MLWSWVRCNCVLARASLRGVLVDGASERFLELVRVSMESRVSLLKNRCMRWWLRSVTCRGVWKLVHADATSVVGAIVSGELIDAGVA